jgi:hypothetical protein
MNTSKAKLQRIANLPNLIHAFGLVIFFGLATRGTWFQLKNPIDGRAHFFTAQADALIHGNSYVNPIFLAGFQGECLDYFGKCYGYFGLVPSILRIPLLPFSNDDLKGVNPFWMITASFLLYIIFANLLAVGLLRYLGTQVSVLFFSFIQISIYASPVLFLITNPYVYYEAILWAISFAFACLYFQIRFLENGLGRNLYLALIFGLLTIHSRVVEGIGVLLSLLLVLYWFRLRKMLSKSIFFINQSLIFIVLLSVPVLNFLRFGEFQPNITNHHGGVNADPYRETFFEAVGVFRIQRIPKLFTAYIFPNFENWIGGFAFTPNNYVLNLLVLKAPLYSVEQSEYFSPFSSTFMFTFVLAIFGLYFLTKTNIKDPLSLIVLGNFASCLFISANIGATQRYLNDFWPFFFILSIIGLSYASSFSKKHLILMGLLPLLLVQVFQTLNVTIFFWKYWPDIPLDFYQMAHEIFGFGLPVM